LVSVHEGQEGADFTVLERFGAQINVQHGTDLPLAGLCQASTLDRDRAKVCTMVAGHHFDKLCQQTGGRWHSCFVKEVDKTGKFKVWISNTVAEADPIGGARQDAQIQTNPWVEDKEHQKRTEKFDQQEGLPALLIEVKSDEG